MSQDREDADGNDNQQMHQKLQVAKNKARDFIVKAEQFKASVNVPQGNITDNPYYSKGIVRDDDEFCHITCHVDSNLRTKIERGEFVELEKLLPKGRTSGSREEVA